MSFFPGFNKDEAQLLLTLSDLSYQDQTPLPSESADDQSARMRRHINASLAAPPSYGDWRVSWGPALTEDRSNMLYVAESPSLSQCAVCIRGTDWAYIEDWLQDVGALVGLTDFPYVIQAQANGHIQIAQGTMPGLQTLLATQGVDETGQKTDPQTFLTSKLQAGADIFVSGHSLGGCLAGVVAAWLASLERAADHLKVYTFAAPSAGNRDFASYYNSLFVDASGNSSAFRVFNSLDAVPNAWSSLSTISSFYNPAPSCSPELRILLAAAGMRVANQYVQVGEAQSAIQLPGTVQLPAAQPLFSLTDDAAFVNQIDYQHATSTYTRLLSQL